MGFLVRQMAIEDYDDVLVLWKSSDAIVLSKVDSQDIIKRLLERNTGLSFVAMDGDKIIGAVLCSHDGRLGYLSHLVVSNEYRRQGIGRQLVSRCMYSLTGLGIHKCILLIMKETEEALQFWRTVDPAGRVSLVMMGPRNS
ncbi:MAG TPA: GNAT family N-acetyltransferase [Anaerolineales bacterium]|jgi:ribosomal protein S18 acetylase RimI-like enzyme|nr:GNAT family N-acetyltransferase [Anaerolineales bacterium]